MSRPLPHRAVHAFNDAPDRLLPLRDAYAAASRVELESGSEQLDLLELLWSDDDPNLAVELTRWVVARLEQLRSAIAEARAAQEDAVDLAEALRGSMLFAHPGLTVGSTHNAITEGLENGCQKIDQPLSPEYTAKLRRAHRRRMGLA